MSVTLFIPRSAIEENVTQAYQRAELITSDELAMIKRVDRQPRNKTEAILLSDWKEYASLYLRLLKKLEPVDTLQSILVLIGDALIGELFTWYTYL